MPARKKAETPVAPGKHIDKPAKKTEKRIEVGDWIMLESPLFVFLHRVAEPRSKQNIKTVCGLEYPPDFSGRKHGARCKQCVERSAAA